MKDVQSVSGIIAKVWKKYKP